MANELNLVDFTSGEVLVAMVVDIDSNVIDINIEMTEVSTGHYQGDMPEGMADGEYLVEVSNALDIPVARGSLFVQDGKEVKPENAFTKKREKTWQEQKQGIRMT